MLSQLKQVQLFKSFFLLPMAMPSATIVLVWKMTFSVDGFLNRLLETHVDFMWTEDAFWVLVFSYVWKNLGYTVILWLAGILAIPGDFIEAARVDGAGSFRVFWSVMLPQLKGSMYTITVLSFLNSFKVFRESYLVAGEWRLFWQIGLPLASGGILSAMVLGFLEYWNMIEQPLAFLKDKSLWPLSLYLPEISQNRAGFAFAASVVTLVPSVFVFLLGQDYLEQGIVASALKE